MLNTITFSDDTSDRWSPLKHNSITPHYLERRTRVRKTRELSKERSVSQDRVFTSFGSWRRKSEPSMVMSIHFRPFVGIDQGLFQIPQQYDAKVIPKKISKLKKSKETGSSTFYTDLSDLENCDLAAESVESLSSKPREDSKEEPDGHVEEISPKTIESNLEKIVSELLMQNQDFHKVSVAACRKFPQKIV